MRTCQDRTTEDPDVVAARNPGPPTIEQYAGRAGQAQRGGAVDHELVVREQVDSSGGMERDRMSGGGVVRRYNPNSSADTAFGADRRERVVIGVLGPRRVQG